MNLVLSVFKDLLKSISDHWVGAIFTIFAIPITYFNKNLYFKLVEIYYWLLDTGIYPNWQVTLIILLVTGLTAWLLVNLWTSKTKKLPVWHNYLTAEIWKVKWSWRYMYDNTYRDIYELHPTCLKCKADLILREDYVSLKVFCPNCKDSVGDYTDMTELAYIKAVKLEIGRTIRHKFDVD